MADNDLQEFKADHSGGDVVKGAEVPEPVTPAGGAMKKRLADVNKSVDPTAAKLGAASSVTPEVKEEAEVSESFESIFEGMEISEEFKSKISLVFEAAVHEAAETKVAEITANLEEEFAAQLEESVSEAMEEVVENLNNYLDYIVSEWMAENAVAIESGIKVQMAESLMDGLKELFYEHNVDIDDTTIDVVADLEEEIASLKEEVNKTINANIELSEMVNSLEANRVFDELSEDLTTSQKERFRVLSEKLDCGDIDSYADDLNTLKESFFKAKQPVLTESAVDEEENEIILEETTSKKVSQYDSVNAIVAAFNSKNFK
jgi:hypothetical protein